MAAPLPHCANLDRPNSALWPRPPLPLYCCRSSGLNSSYHPRSRYGAALSIEVLPKSRTREKISSFSAFSTARADAEGGGEDQQQEVEEYSVISAIRSAHNDIVVVDTPTSRVLLLDSTHNVHSILNKDENLTGSYWDEFATLPAIVPKGPIAILGLGAGTAARIMLELWPSLHLEGWEIDEILIDKARDYFELSDLEKYTADGGFLSIKIGDAFSPSATIPGGFAGIVVDLFSEGEILPQLQQAETWLDLEKRLMPHGRIIANCGGAHYESFNRDDGLDDPKSFLGSSWVQNSTIQALCKAFPGKLSWKRMKEKESENYLALTGPMPDIISWAAAVPSQLSSNVNYWKPCNLIRSLSPRKGFSNSDKTHGTAN